MKIFLTGAKGQLGRELCRRLGGAELLATDLPELDITDSRRVGDVIGGYKPDVVIHAAAYTRVDAAEENVDKAWKVNAIGAQNIAVACRQVQAAMVYISTDYVFDGKLGRAYTELDVPNPLNVYGKSKYAGELLARNNVERLYILRTAWLYGEGTNFVRTMLKLAGERDAMQVVNDQYGSPTSSVDLAEAVLRMIGTQGYGTYHVVNGGVTNWYGLAKKIFELTGNTQIEIQPVSTEQFARPAQRPAYSPLDTSLLRLVTGWTPRGWEEALAEYLYRQDIFTQGKE